CARRGYDGPDYW
nr:immunoglobulin heavy chain junction region [Mus musculus]